VASFFLSTEHQRNSLRVAFIHPDLGIGANPFQEQSFLFIYLFVLNILSGGAERLVVDAALGLQQAGHQVVMFTSHHDTNHCLDETRNGALSASLRPGIPLLTLCGAGTLKVIVHGDALPRSLGGRFKAFFAYLRNVRPHNHAPVRLMCSDR
jgi:alpha-1,3/alpha-1,6-mannosyltransferase